MSNLEIASYVTHQPYSWITDVHKFEHLNVFWWDKTVSPPVLNLDPNMNVESPSKLSVLGEEPHVLKITPPEIPFSAHYKQNGWDFERIWTQVEGVEAPKLIWRPGLVDLGDPLTHNMNYFYVVPHIKGTMSYLGLTWKSMGAFFSFPDPPAQGVLGQEVTYSIPDSDLNARIIHEIDGDIDVTWFASGVRDVEGAGGISGYNDQKRRTVVVGNQASATVNFYFTQPHMIPTVNYKASISTPDGVVDVRAVSKEMSALKFCVDANIQLGIALVERDDARATKIRVAMPEGIKAFQVYSKYSDIEMEED